MFSLKSKDQSKPYAWILTGFRPEEIKDVESYVLDYAWNVIRATNWSGTADQDMFADWRQSGEPEQAIAYIMSLQPQLRVRNGVVFEQFIPGVAMPLSDHLLLVRKEGDGIAVLDWRGTRGALPAGAVPLGFAVDGQYTQMWEGHWFTNDEVHGALYTVPEEA